MLLGVTSTRNSVHTLVRVERPDDLVLTLRWSASVAGCQRATASARIASSCLSSTAPSSVWVAPWESTTTTAGWLGTENRAKMSPRSSLMVGNLRACLSMKPWKAASSPVHATPTKSTLPSHLCRAASTEAASALQTLQVGAQNQNTTGRPAMVAPSNDPPPTSGAVKASALGTPVAAAVAVAAGPAPDDGGVDAPHAVNPITTVRKATIPNGRRTGVVNTLPG